MLRQTLKTDAVHRLVDACFGQYLDGLVTNVQQGAVPAQSQSLARYVAKDVVSPPIAVRRIARYDGARVTYHYRCHRTERVEPETVDVATFIGRRVQPMVPKGCKRIRYCGVQATKTFAKVKGVIQAALAKVEGVVKGAVQIIARLTSRQRYEQSTGARPVGLSALSACDGDMAQLAPDLRDHLRRGREDQTGYVCLHRATSRSLMKGVMCPKCARRALCVRP